MMLRSRTAFALLTLFAFAAADACWAQQREFNVPEQAATTGIPEFARQARIQILAAEKATRGKRTAAVIGTFEVREALLKLLAGTHLVVDHSDGQTITLVPESGSSPSTAKPTSSVPPAENSNLDASAEPVAGNAAAPGEGLTEIVVTAQRREESAKKVPISITALNQRTMDDLQIQNVRDLATIIPGLALTPQVAVAQDTGDVAIRGIFAGSNSPTTQLYIDETPVAIRQLGASLSKSPWPQIFDLDRVEVLRGPQGTLFGASAMGGAIRFITPQPSLIASGGSATADVAYTQGGNPSYEIGAAYGAPIVSGTAGFRVSAWYQSQGGFIDRGDRLSGQILERNANRADAYVIRPAVTWAPSEALSVTGAIFLQHTHGENGNSYWLNGLPDSQASGHVWDGVDQPLTDDLRVASLSLKYGNGGLSFVSDTSYLYRTSSAIEDVSSLYLSILNSLANADNHDPFIMGLPSSFAVLEENHSSTRAWQQEFRLSSGDPAAPVTWVAGAFYRRAVQNLFQLQPPSLTPATEALFGQTSEQFFGVPDYIANGQALNFYDNYSTTDLSEAVFGDVAWQMTPRLKLDVGLRYEHLIVQDQKQFTAGPFNGGALSVTLPDENANPVTPRVSLSQRYSDSGMVYVSAAKGYRPGGGNSANANIEQCRSSLDALGLAAAPASFGSDSLWSYELGVKDTLFDRRLSIDGSVYYIRWSRIQTPVTLPSCGNSFVENVGAAISRGFDLQLDAAVTSNLTLHSSISYTDVYYPSALYGAPPTDSNGNPIGPATLSHAAGEKVANVIPWTVAANARYTRNISSIWPDTRAYLQLDYRHLNRATTFDPRTSRYALDPLAASHPDPAYGILNIRLGVLRGGLDFSAYVNNATHADPILGYYDSFGYAPSLHFAGTIRPFTVGLTTWYRF